MADYPGLAIGVGPEEHVTQAARAKKQAATANITAVLSHGGIFFFPPPSSTLSPFIYISESNPFICDLTCNDEIKPC